MRRIRHVLQLGLKEFRGLARDLVLVVLIIYLFTGSVILVATGAMTEVENASVAIADADRSDLSRRIADALLPPQFRPVVQIGHHEIDAGLDTARVSFVLNIPDRFQEDLLAGRHPEIQLLVDATAMTLAGNGSNYIRSVIEEEILNFAKRRSMETTSAVPLRLRTIYNPNLEATWFLAVNQVINAITILTIILTGAAVIREREQGTIEHLLVMPLRPIEIMAAKIWANGLVIVVCASSSLYVVVQMLLDVPVKGSPLLFVLGAGIYVFAVSSLGIMLATIGRSMPQFGLLALLTTMIMILLSGGITPLGNMPELLQWIMMAAPSVHFISFTHSLLYRGANLEILWPDLLAIAGLGLLYFMFALLRFRKTMMS